jgi:hypothetical protein
VRVFYRPPNTSGYLPLPGPADLAGKMGGRIRVVAEDGDTDSTRTAWIIAIGNFVVRGGKVS